MQLVSLEKHVTASADEGASIVFAREPFDSDLFGLEIGRIHSAQASDASKYHLLFDSLLSRARTAGYDQVLRRTALENLAEIWGLQASGFELMDVVVTFARPIAPGVHSPQWADLRIEPATDDTVMAIVRDMVDDPWNSRYESDPAYTPSAIRALRRKWLLNSYRGRAAAFFVGTIDGRPVGYVTCVIHRPSGEGEIELVGTIPAFRGRRVASRIIEHALCWFSERCSVITVRTQATNYAAAGVYERAGFTLRGAEATFRANVKSQRTAQA